MANVKLTEPQIYELRKQRDGGSQPTFGPHRAKVQNRLVKLGLSTFVLDQDADWINRCAITDAGRQALSDAGK